MVKYVSSVPRKRCQRGTIVLVIAIIFLTTFSAYAGEKIGFEFDPFCRISAAGLSFRAVISSTYGVKKNRIFYDLFCMNAQCDMIQIDLSKEKVSVSDIAALKVTRKVGTNIVEWGSYRTFEVDRNDKKIIFRYHDDKESYSAETPCGESQF